MDIKRSRDFRAGERAQELSRAGLKKTSLELYNAACDIFERLSALLKVLEKKLRPFDMFRDMLFLVFVMLPASGLHLIVQIAIHRVDTERERLDSDRFNFESGFSSPNDDIRLHRNSIV